MEDEYKTREQLIKELAELRQQVADFKSSETDYRHVQEKLAMETNQLRTLIDAVPSAKAPLFDELRKSENRYRYIVETTNEGIWTIDSENLTTYVNTALAQMLGYEPGEMIGVPVKSFVFAEDIADHNSQMAIRHSGKSSKYERRLNRKDGSICYCLISGTAMHDEEGRFTGAFAMVTDITGRKRLEEILKEEQQELKLIIDSSPIIVFYKDKEGKFIRVNKAFAEALKMPEEEFMGKTAFDLYSAKIAQGMTNDDQEVLKSGRPKINIIEQYESPSGIRWVQTDKIPISDKNGIPVGLIGFAQDITERKKAEEELEKYRTHLEELVDNRTLELLKSAEKLNQAKERLSNLNEQLRNLAAHLQSLREEERIILSHEIHDELGHKLTGMKFDLMFLLNTMSGSEEEKRLVSEKIHSMCNLIDSVVKWARDLITSLRPSILDDMGIEAALEWLVKDFQSKLQIPCILNSSIKNLRPGSELTSAIFRICQECLTNISRHAHATSVTITLRKIDRNLILEVIDKGIGITADQIKNPKSFGLIGIRERAFMLGGDFKITTGEKGKGTRVTVLLPAGS